MPLSCEPPGLRQYPSASAGVHCNTPEFGLPGLPSATWFLLDPVFWWSVGFTAHQLIRLPSLDSGPTPEPCLQPGLPLFAPVPRAMTDLCPKESRRASSTSLGATCAHDVTNVRFRSRGSQAESPRPARTRARYLCIACTLRAYDAHYLRIGLVVGSRDDPLRL